MRRPGDGKHHKLLSEAGIYFNRHANYFNLEGLGEKTSFFLMIF